MATNPHPHLTFRAEPEFIERLRDAAKSDERSLSSALRLAAARYVAEREAASAPKATA